MSWSRRRFLGTAGAGLLAPWVFPRPVLAMNGIARRVIFFYFPDGIVGPSQNGDASKFHCSGGEFDFHMPSNLDSLGPWRDRCLFFNGLSLGGTDAGSHPGGAKKLLTAADGGQGESIDQFLSRTAGAGAYWRHLYLGAQANVNGASGDKHIVYPTPGQSMAPQDDPRAAFERLFGGAPSGGTGSAGAVDPRRATVIDHVLGELISLRTRLGKIEAAKLDLHIEAAREVEARISAVAPEGLGGSCEEPDLDTAGLQDHELYAPERFPDILRSQIDLTVLAMRCGLTQVGTIQCSHHTSELIMSRFAGTEMHDPGYDMRSHQASHYGSAHDPAKLEYYRFEQQRQWFVGQFSYLLEQLDATPEGDGTMLDHSICVLCSEVSDGNTHSHDQMPFIVAGGAGGYWSTGRLLDYGYRRHADLWITVARAMGQDINRFGWDSSGPLL